MVAFSRARKQNHKSKREEAKEAGSCSDVFLVLVPDVLKTKEFQASLAD